jgi:hypothetical protein
MAASNPESPGCYRDTSKMEEETDPLRGTAMTRSPSCQEEELPVTTAAPPCCLAHRRLEPCSTGASSRRLKPHATDGQTRARVAASPIVVLSASPAATLPMSPAVENEREREDERDRERFSPLRLLPT